MIVIRLFSGIVLVFMLAVAHLHLSAQQMPLAHDPVLIKQDSTYYIFCTGWGISVLSSTDMKTWKKEKPVFTKAPEWAVDSVKGFKGHIWAPDISYFNGEYYLYYSISAFGKNTSCIGLATNKTLNPSDPEFAWIDHGLIIQSIPNKTNWNAIDPNLIVDKKNVPYLCFGSFWDGLKMVRLTPDAQKVDMDITQIPTIASRKTKPGMPNPPSIDDNPVEAGGNAIEAPFIFKHKKYYYLFASVDYCCKGIKSTYKMIVGRSKSITGPYIDKAGFHMEYGGGTLLMKGDENWYGVGHNAVAHIDGIDYLVYHGYDAHDEGKAKLRISRLKWDKMGWPQVEIGN